MLGLADLYRHAHPNIPQQCEHQIVSFSRPYSGPEGDHGRIGLRGWGLGVLLRLNCIPHIIPFPIPLRERGAGAHLIWGNVCPARYLCIKYLISSPNFVLT